MIDAAKHRLNLDRRQVLTVVVVGLLILSAWSLGALVQMLGLRLVMIAALGPLMLVAVLWRTEIGIFLLMVLPMFVPMLLIPAASQVQGREVNVLHFLAAAIIASWLLRKMLVDRRLTLPKTALTAPLIALWGIWLLTWIAGYVFWDSRVPTVHRQPLFFVAEFGQLLLFSGVFWATADSVHSDRTALVVCLAAIASKALSPFLFGHLLYFEYPVAAGLLVSLLAFGMLTWPLRAALIAAIPIFAWDIWSANRIPISLGVVAAALTVIFLRSRRLFVVAALVALVVGGAGFRARWYADPSVPARLMLAKLALTMFRDHPLLGIGPTHYRSYALLYHHGVSYGWDKVENGMLLPHNIWLYFLANTGIVGLAGMLWLVAAIAWSSLSAHRRATEPLTRALAAGTLACIVAVLVQSIGGHAGLLPEYNTLGPYVLPVWILMGLLAARHQPEQPDHPGASHAG